MHRQIILATTTMIGLIAVATTAQAQSQANPANHSTQFGSSIPLSEVVKAAAPPGAKIHFLSGTDPNTPVTWATSDPDWKKNVSNLARAGGAKANIIGDTVTIQPESTTQEPAAAQASKPATKPAAARTTTKKWKAHTRTETATTTTSQKRSRHAPNPGVGHGGYDSPTINQMSPQTALAATLPPAGGPGYPGTASPDELRTAMGGTGAPYSGYSPDYHLANQSGEAIPYSSTSPTLNPAAPRGYVSPSENPAHAWHYTAGTDIYTILQQWCAQTGGLWNVTKDRHMVHTAPRISGTLYGTFDQVVNELGNQTFGDVQVYIHMHKLDHQIYITDSEHEVLSQSN